MRNAVLMAGYLRVFHQNLPQLKKTFFKRLKQYDLYVHITLDEFHSDKYYSTAERKNLENLVKSLNPVQIFYEENQKFSKNLKENNILNTWYKFNKLFNFVINTGISYDCVYKIRPDIVFSENFQHLDIRSNDVNLVYIPRTTLVDKEKLAKSSDPSICDIFAYGSQIAMSNYFKIYHSLDNLIRKYGCVPETLLFYFLKDEKIKYHLVDLDFSILLSECNVIGISGDSGVGKSQLAERLKRVFNNSVILEGDRYHRWERDDKNWKTFTHLDPKSNYIAKMRSDIFDLKIGNSIYQVDYNHVSGKFTNEKKIDPQKNIIVCGLHSLYGKHHHLYNLKIFIDTEDDVKKDWKISRDVLERGKTEKKVIEEIKKRRNDYTKHIIKQRFKSDIIIYYSKNEKEKLVLTLYVHRKFDISQLIKKMKMQELIFKIKDSKSQYFCEFVFSEYKFKPIFGDIGKNEYSNNYYDYIVFVILSLYNREA
jgi:uridine kinase